ncbi:DUF5011 domain-containing protein [Lactobacillus sp. YT155]|uniref:immunoglobulin-like domain-containing protein n=1 Tax=Lactobacillus sp. YT155 TaxID=3060955 RepID=UPI00265EEB16|nr:immunoglobulin-like domain-containing protein [Lactobacillus sp. YT155]MDO1604844.1 DUF5011 domain-containing protein [Lactobacillus sp. YT155]
MVKKTRNTVKIATYGALLAVFSGAITTPVSAATNGSAENVKVEAVKNNAAKKEATVNSDSSAKPASTINGITWGDMSYSGSAASGLQVNNGVTSGELSFKLDVSSLAGVNLNETTYFRVKLPEEFRALAKTSAFRNAITGSFRSENFGGIFNNEYNYNSSDIRVDTTNNEILFTNRPMTNIQFLAKTTLNMTINLGQAINESGVRIADSYDGYYHAQSALAQSGNWIDWTIGNRESKVDIPLRVMDPGAATPENTRPEINTSAKNTTVSLNSKFDNAKALEGVTAYDKEDGDITRKIIVTSNTVDTSKAGYYVVSYEVFDSKGLEAQTSVMIHVVDDTPAKDYSLTPNSYNLGSSTLTGKYGKDIYKVRLFIDGKVVAQATTKDGAFTFSNANKFITDKNHLVEVVGVDSEYKEQARKVVTVTGEPAKDYSLTPNEYKLGSAELNGHYGKDVAHVRLFINGTVVTQADSSKGYFTFKNASKFIKNKDQKVEVVAVDGAYKEQNRKTVTVTGEAAKDYSLTPNSYKIGDATLTGSYGKDVARVRLFINGSVVTQADTSNGKFTVKNANKFIKNKDQKVEVVAVDGAYKEQNRKAVTVTGESQKDYSLFANTYNMGTSNLTGTYGKDVYKVRLFVNGSVVAQATTKDGNYTFNNVDKFVTENEDVIQVKAVNSNYEVVNTVNVNKNGSIVHDYKLTANDYVLGSSTLSGTEGADIARVRVRVNGQIVKQADLQNGTYTAKGLTGLISKDDKVEAVGVDSQFKEVAVVKVNVVADDANHDYSLTAPDTYQLGADIIKGNFGKDIKAVRLVVNGNIVKNADMDTAAGVYTLKGLEYLDIKVGDTVQVVGVDSTYHQQVSKTISIVG